MTGHGKFKSYLRKFKLADSNICSCGQDAETAEHVLLYCKLFSCERDKFKKKSWNGYLFLGLLLCLRWSIALSLLLFLKILFTV